MTNTVSRFVGNFNCRGILPNCEQVMDFLRLDTLILTETWQQNITDLPLENIQISGTPSKNRARFGKGIAIISRFKLQRIKCIDLPHIQAIICRLPNHITLIAIYLQPQQRKHTLLHALKQLKPYIRDKCCVVGDFNARHRSWDSSSNTHGNTLKAWCQQIGAKIYAPNTPSCKGASNPDLFLGKGLNIEEVSCESGSWHSDHRLVRARVYTNRHWKPLQVPDSILNNPEIQNQAKQHYRKHLPILTTELQNDPSPTNLEDNIELFIDTLLRPFRKFVRDKPARFRLGWNQETDQLAKKRSKLLRKQSQQHCQFRAARIKLIDKIIKKQVRINKRIACMQQTARLEKLPPRELAIQFSRNRILHSNSNSTSISGDVYRDWMQDSQTHDSNILPCTMQIPENFRYDIIQALNQVKQRRATGMDGVSAEMLTLEKEIVAKYLYQLWKSIGITGYMPSPLLQGFVVPIFKKGDTSLPVSYRPITLLSHIRKVLSIALNIRIQREYTSHENQFGFTKNCGTELPTLHAHNLTKTGHKYLAVLDLKQAYPSVRRSYILSESSRKLSAETCSMINNFLVPCDFICKNQVEPTAGKLTLGVPQGDPVSPTLYKIFMDTFLEMIDRQDIDFSDMAAICFVDDVLLASKTRDGMQILLHVCESWARQYQMTWSVPKCSIISVDQPTLTLNNIPIKVVNSATYLGSSLSANGLNDSIINDRITKAQDQLSAWRKVESSTMRLPRAAKCILVSTILLPSAEFGFHLTQISITTKYNYDTLLKKCVQWVMPHCATSATKRGLSILRLTDIATRRKCLQLTRLVRVHNLAFNHKSESDNVSARECQIASTFLRLLTNHQPTRATARQYAIETVKDEAIGQKFIDQGKISLRALFFEQANSAYRRRIPTKATSLPAYNLPGLTRLEKGFIDRWYLNQLSHLQHEHARELNFWLSKESFDKNEKPTVLSLIRHINKISAKVQVSCQLRK